MKKDKEEKKLGRVCELDDDTLSQAAGGNLKFRQCYYDEKSNLFVLSYKDNSLGYIKFYSNEEKLHTDLNKLSFNNISFMGHAQK